jgi:cytidine deaminase
MSDGMPNRDALIAAAEAASGSAYAPYSGFHVGAALAFADGTVVTGANVENASYGLTLCAETSAVASAMNQGKRGGLVAVAITARRTDGVPLDAPVTPCGRCRQVLEELAGLGATDPVVWCAGGADILELRLSALLPYAFRKDNFRS